MEQIGAKGKRSFITLSVLTELVFRPKKATWLTTLKKQFDQENIECEAQSLWQSSQVNEQIPSGFSFHSEVDSLASIKARLKSKNQKELIAFFVHKKQSIQFSTELSDYVFFQNWFGFSLLVRSSASWWTLISTLHQNVPFYTFPLKHSWVLFLLEM